MSSQTWLSSTAIGTLASGLIAFGAVAQDLDEVTFGTNWKAQAEHGGYYQAVATGIYEEHGLDVTIRPGGPQVNHPQLLAAGQIDFNMGSNIFSALNYVQNDVPMVAVAAIFQKDPQILMAHPDQGIETLDDMQGMPVLISTGCQDHLLGMAEDRLRLHRRPDPPLHVQLRRRSLPIRALPSRAI